LVHLLIFSTLLKLKLPLSLVDSSVPQQKRLAAEQQSSHDDVSDRNDDEDDAADDAVDDGDHESSSVLPGRARYLLCI